MHTEIDDKLPYKKEDNISFHYTSPTLLLLYFGFV